MDCYQTESEFIDSLDFLSPPVKRICSKDLFGCSYNAEPNNIRLFRGIRKKFASKEKGEPKKEKEQLKKDRKTAKTGGGSSTSLVLKKTSERKILQRYTVVSYTSLHSANKAPDKANKSVESKRKPLIKVTVISKNDQAQTAKLLRKRRSVPKKVQSTLSNQENSVKTNNLYVVVAGRRNKIYEIKTTGSATFSSDQTRSNYTKNDISVEGLAHVKQLLQSLNMDLKPKKDKRENKTDDFKKASFSNNRNDPAVHASKGIDPYDYERYTYSNNQGRKQKPLNRSRVRVYGQLGLTDDDRYVLRYGASVNDKPVTDFAQLTQDFLPQVLPPSACIPNQYEANPEVTKEASVQAASYDAYYPNQQPTVSNFVYRKESQGTQVNFNIPAAPRNYPKASRIVKDVQCSCNYVVENKPVDNKYELNALKDGQSPLVIISVYPKQSPQEMMKYNTELCPQSHKDAYAQCVPKLEADKGTNRKTTETKVEQSNNKRNNSAKKNTNKPPLNRSRSPIKNVSQGKLPNNDNETIVLKTQTDATPDRFKAMRVIKNKILEKDRTKTETPKTSKINRPIATPVQRSKSPVKRYSPTRSQERGTNTEHAKAKKDLVDTYTKQLTNKMNYKDMVPAKLDNSRVTINIEGDRENYNVLFDQSKISTDLRVNKTMKTKNSQKNRDRVTSPSLENLLWPEKEPHVQSKSVPICDQQFDENITNKRVSGMTVRDSLEISHRRENNHGCGVASTRTYIHRYCIDDLTNSPESIAPIKHYTGDDCSISDPVERDKQIRELLGVKKSNCITPNSLQVLQVCINKPTETVNKADRIGQTKASVKKQVAEINLIKYCPMLGSLAKVGKKKCCPKTHCPNDFCSEQFCWGYDYNNDEAVVCTDQRSERVLSPREETSIDKENQTVPRNTENSAIYQQLILNRNIQIFLQVEQFSKQRPIILSRKQYDKVKRIIQTNLNRKCRCKEFCKKQEKDRYSDVCVGDVRSKMNQTIPLQFDQQIQTDWVRSKNSFQRPSKRPKMISKVKYLVKLSKSKDDRQCLEDKDAKQDECPTFKDEDRYYQFHSQKDNDENVELLIPYSQTYKYFRPTNEHFQMQQRYSTNYNRFKELTETKGECEYVPCVTMVNKKYLHKQGNYINKQQTFIDSQRKDLKECTKINDKHIFGSGEHGMFVNKYDCDDYEIHEACQQMAKNNLNIQNKECIKEIKEYHKFVPKYCADCGKCYRSNKECCKEIQNINNNDKIHNHTEQNQINEVSTDVRESGKKCKEIKELFKAGPRITNKENHAIGDGRRKKTESRYIHSREHVVSNGVRHRGCGEYSIKSPEALINKLHAKPEQSNETHSIHVHQNTDIYKTNTVEENRVTKQDHYEPHTERSNRVKEHKLVNTCTPVLGDNKASSEEHLNHVATLEKHHPNEITRFKDDKYQKRRKESDHEQRIHETYVGLNEKFQDYFSDSIKVDEYFGQNVEYCRLDVEHYTKTQNGDNTINDRYIGTSDKRFRHRGERDHQTERKEQIKAVTLHDDEREQKQDSLQVVCSDQSTKNTVSSLEIHYTSVAYLEKNDLASSEVAVCSDSSVCHVNSIQTIFRGRRKTPTPNLGTSVCSMYSEDGLQLHKSTKFIMTPHEVKPNKRPFLRRLMSCLVMRSARASELRLPISPAKEIPSVNSSVDSYHISTSLGAVEVSSSIYDTSASFYSNHTILPTNSKIKRGFFNSVRGFLTNRRS